MRKIAALAYLVANGTLTRDTVLFWDEPGASLNPRLVVKVVEFVRALARADDERMYARREMTSEPARTTAQKQTANKQPAKATTKTKSTRRPAKRG